MCLGLYEDPAPIEFGGGLPPAKIGFPRRVGGVCTITCKDGDCPTGMRCEAASRSTALRGFPDLGPGTPNAFACAPVRE
jgi:hypothetical protein